MHLIFLAMFVFVLSPPFNSIVEYYYTLRLNFKNTTFVIKNIISSLANFLSILLLYLLTMKFKKRNVYAFFGFHFLSLALLLVVFATDAPEYIDMDTVMSLVFTFWFDFTYQLIYITLLSILTLFSPRHIEGSIVSIIDFVLGGGIQLSTYATRKLIKMLKVEIDNNYDNVGWLIAIHVLIKLISTIIFIFYKVPDNVKISDAVDHVGSRARIETDLLGIDTDSMFDSFVEAKDDKIDNLRSSIKLHQSRKSSHLLNE